MIGKSVRESGGKEGWKVTENGLNMAINIALRSQRRNISLMLSVDDSSRNIGYRDYINLLQEGTEG